MSEVEKSHNDIFRRVEKVEVEVAVLNNKTDRFVQDLTDLRAETRVNGEISREVKTKVDSLPRVITVAISLVSVIFAILSYATRNIT